MPETPNKPDVKTLTVDLGSRSYPIFFGREPVDLLNLLAERYRQRSQIGFYLDTHVYQAQQADLDACCKKFPGFKKVFSQSGEGLKSTPALNAIWEDLGEHGFDRSSLLVACGGGVIGDLVGFAAATWNRGIDLVQVPTTLLAMVDSSVGGKTGINTRHGKNLAGAFWQPRAVFIATGFLRSLPPREFAAGMAEVIKYGLLADHGLFAQLARRNTPLQPDSSDLTDIISTCCRIKAEIVKADETETAAQGGRALLNLGHTFAHAIENAAGYGDYLHGEAVSIGLVLAAQLSHRLGLIPDTDVQNIVALLESYHLPVRLRTPIPLENLFAAMRRDKKVRQGSLRFVILEKTGQAATREGIPESLIGELLIHAGAGVH